MADTGTEDFIDVDLYIAHQLLKLAGRCLSSSPYIMLIWECVFSGKSRGDGKVYIYIMYEYLYTPCTQLSTQSSKSKIFAAWRISLEGLHHLSATWSFPFVVKLQFPACLDRYRSQLTGLRCTLLSYDHLKTKELNSRCVFPCCWVVPYHRMTVNIKRTKLG